VCCTYSYCYCGNMNHDVFPTDAVGTYIISYHAVCCIYSYCCGGNHAVTCSTTQILLQNVNKFHFVPLLTLLVSTVPQEQGMCHPTVTPNRKPKCAAMAADSTFGNYARRREARSLADALNAFPDRDPEVLPETIKLKQVHLSEPVRDRLTKAGTRAGVDVLFSLVDGPALLTR
jgi:hypothetical protein